MTAGAIVAGAAGLGLGSQAARRAVEAELAGQFGAHDLILTDGGTGALSLAIRIGLSARRGAAVALPAYSCYDLATAADGADASVLLYDVDPGTLAPDLASLESALARGAGAVVLAHLYGVPTDPAPVRAVAQRHGAWLVEDAAQGAGAKVAGLPLGSFGDFTVLSFGRGKGITAGRGGALLAREPDAVALLPAARAPLLPPRRGAVEVAQLAALWLLARPSLYSVPARLPFLHLGETIYRPPPVVHGLSDASARALAVTWQLREREAAARRASAARLLARLPGGLVPPHVPDNAEAGYLRLPLVASPESRAEAETDRARSLGITTGYPLALCDLAGFRKRILNADCEFPGARLLAQRLITLPTHSWLRAADLLALERWVAEQ